MNVLLSCKPYIIRAFYEWLLDNKLTPYLMVDMTKNSVKVPRLFNKNIYNNTMILNIAPCAVKNIDLGNLHIQFLASFNGLNSQIIIPISAVIAIYANENGIGTMFKEDLFIDEYLFNKHKSNTHKMQNSTLKLIK